LKEGESPVLPGEEEREQEEGGEGLGSLGRSFLYTLNLGVGRHYVITWLLLLVGLGEEPLKKEGEQSQIDPNLAYLTRKNETC
jgi:hypothetical protein